MRNATLKVTALAGGCVLLVGGCTSSKNERAAPRPSPLKSVTSSAAPTALPTQASLPPLAKNDVTARKQITQTGCAAVPGGWAATGTAKNPGSSPVTYKITIYFTTTSATTLNYAVTSVTVPPGQTAKWTARKRFKAQQQMLCPMPSVTVS